MEFQVDKVTVVQVIFPSTLVFPYQYLSTNDPYSFIHLPPMPHNHGNWWCHKTRLRKCLCCSSNTTLKHINGLHNHCSHLLQDITVIPASLLDTCRNSGLMVILRRSCRCGRIDLRHIISAFTGRQPIGCCSGACRILTGI